MPRNIKKDHMKTRGEQTMKTMKMMKLNLPLVFLCALVLVPVLSVLLVGCGGGGGGGAEAPPPPPSIINASFEVLGANPDGGQPYGWIREGMNDWSHDTLGVRRKTGTGFMPTDGQYFLEFPASDAGTGIFPGHYPLLTAYQDDVNLSGATSLVFDYEVTDRSIFAGSGGGYDGAATVSIFFQPNGGGSGTIVLWSKNYGPGTAGEQVFDMSVPLSNLSVPGRLTIQVTAAASRQNSLVSLSKLTFRIDFIGVQ